MSIFHERFFSHRGYIMYKISVFFNQCSFDIQLLWSPRVGELFALMQKNPFVFQRKGMNVWSKKEEIDVVFLKTTSSIAVENFLKNHFIETDLVLFDEVQKETKIGNCIEFSLTLRVSKYSMFCDYK